MYVIRHSRERSKQSREDTTKRRRPSRRTTYQQRLNIYPVHRDKRAFLKGRQWARVVKDEERANTASQRGSFMGWRMGSCLLVFWFLVFGLWDKDGRVSIGEEVNLVNPTSNTKYRSAIQCNPRNTK